jgi:hypothetical protein
MQSSELVSGTMGPERLIAVKREAEEGWGR